MTQEDPTSGGFKDPITGIEIYDIPRQHSQCKILIYSHVVKQDNDEGPSNNGFVDCTNDVINCETSKSIKGGGGASFTLVPRRNYINLIYPNDYVHIYFDPGDGRGFIRTFFGFVDRVERSITTDNLGSTQTQFNVTCSDFTKAFDKTNIYFNPHLAERADFRTQFAGRRNIAGSALRTKGIRVWGTPADVVISLAQRLMGFGSQFVVPPGHPVINSLVNISRTKRLTNLLISISNDLLNYSDPDTLEALKKKTEKEKALIVKTGVQDLLNAIPSALARENAEEEPLTPKQLSKLLETPPDGIQFDLQALKRVIQQARDIFRRSEQNISLLDLIDFSFVEHNAIDGSILSASIWQSTGTLWSIMNAWSNGDVNELFCDLRPVSKNTKFDVKEGGYSNSPDENAIAGNGILMVPALVMREYPFATIESVKPGSILFSGVLEDIFPVPVEERWKHQPIPIAGFGPGGGVFSRDPGNSGRKVLTIKSLNPFRPGAKGTKHLDVIAISTQDIISERIGRDDQGVANFIEVYSDLGIGKHGKYLTQELQPIATPISVMRDGLRVQTFVSKYARWPAKNSKDAGLDSPSSRFQVVRWALMLDHWYQHSKEYLNGTISLRAFPEIRVGYRLDIKERAESYYVEGVNHAWSFTDQGSMLMTTLTVSRGQRNDPYPIHVHPPLQMFGGARSRGEESRLAYLFDQKNTSSISGASISLEDYQQTEFSEQDFQNTADIPKLNLDTWGARTAEFLAQNATPTQDDEDKASIKKTQLDLREKRYARIEDIEVQDPGGLTGGSGSGL